MGAQNWEVENGLYGIKTELTKKFKNDTVPRWLSNEFPCIYGGEQDITQDMSAGAFLKAHRDRQREGKAFGSKTRVGFSVGNHAPSQVQEKMDEYTDSSAHRKQMRGLGEGEWFSGFYVIVIVGSRGGIRDISLNARYED